MQVSVIFIIVPHRRLAKRRDTPCKKRALLFLAACGGSAGSGGSTGGAQAGHGGVSGTGTGGTSVGSGGSGVGGITGSGGQVAGASGSGGQAGKAAAGGQVAGASGSGGQAGATAAGGTTGTGAGGQTAGAGGQAGRTGIDGGVQTGGTTGIDGGLVSGCVGKAWPTADPTTAGPFTVTAEKNVGPLAGALPDPVYKDQQQSFNVYRPKDLATSGYCHPILVWANGHGDNPEPNPPSCVTGGGQYCGSYLMLMDQLASHGFVVIASLSTTTSQGDPLPTIVGLNWLLQQAEDPTNTTYYHRLDTAHIGALGHSEGGASTCKAAADPRITAVATVSGTSTITSLHGPALFFCGGKEAASVCDNIKSLASSIKDQPSMFVDNLDSDHGGWLYQNGAKGPDIFGFTAWFRVHLMARIARCSTARAARFVRTAA